MQPPAQLELHVEQPEASPAVMQKSEEEAPASSRLPQPESFTAAPPAVVPPDPAPAAKAPVRTEEVAPRAGAAPFDLKEVLAGTGLQMVDTRAGSPPHVDPEPETVQLGRPRRSPPQPPVEEQLVQIETRK
jgi:hypothetical protein